MKFLFSIFLFLFSGILFAQKIDADFFKKINGTKWELIGEKDFKGKFLKKKKQVAVETITFSDGSILFDLPDAHYACNYIVKNNYELWLSCAEPDQYIYKIRSLNNRELVMDVFVKTKDGKFIRKKRMTYHIVLS